MAPDKSNACPLYGPPPNSRKKLSRSHSMSNPVLPAMWKAASPKRASVNRSARDLYAALFANGARGGGGNGARSRSIRLLLHKAPWLHVGVLLPMLLLVALAGVFIVAIRATFTPSHPPTLRRLRRGRAATTSPLLPPHTRARAGVSLVACCMNRQATLRKTLPAWRAVHDVSEIIVLDWASDPPLHPLVTELAGDDPRVRVIRVDNESNWVLTRAYNLAISSTTHAQVIRTDCDYAIHRDFVRAHAVQSHAFHAGNYAHARNENEVHLNGAVYIRRADFLAVGGYDERIQTYGWDDEDLYSRLELAGLRKLNLSYDHVTHIPHGDAARAQHDVKFVQVEIDLNALLLKHLPKWTASSAPRNQWATAFREPRFLRLHAAHKPRALKQLVSTRDLNHSWNLALGQRLANDYQIPWDIMEAMNTTSKRTLLKRLNLRSAHRPAHRPVCILFVHCMHGLGNRLRALASAMSFANTTDRELVVIWEKDAHISASFDDLFVDNLVVLSRFKPKWPFNGYERYDKSWLRFSFYNYMEMEKGGAVKGQHVIDAQDKHIYIKSAYVIEADATLTNWNADNAMLRTLTPVDEVRALVKQHEAKGLSRMIGVHIRDRTLERDIQNVDFDNEYGDVASREIQYWRQKSSYHNFAAEMTRLLRKEPDVRFYVATDTVHLFTELERIFPGRVSCTRRDCDGRDGRCVRFALVDVLCLGRTKMLIGSNWSSFTEAASRFGGLAPRLAGKDFALDENSGDSPGKEHATGIDVGQRGNSEHGGVRHSQVHPS